MRLSFDLDDTLICIGTDTPSEPLPAWYCRYLVSREPLRLGMKALVRQLQSEGWEVWIYTTSYRPAGAIRRWFWSHGIRVAGIVNQDKHLRLMKSGQVADMPSKIPSAFGIDLHVDNDPHVQAEGSRYGFATVLVEPEDLSWTEKVLAAARDIKRLKCQRRDAG